MAWDASGVAVTGASGFLGARLVTGLLDAGRRVYALTSRPERVPPRRGLTVLACGWDSADLDAAVSRIRGATLWVHAAARIDFQESSRRSFQLYRANALLTDSLAAHVASLDGARLVYLSTVSVYGRGQQIAADVDPAPDADYGLSKLLGERLSLARLGGRCAVLRLAGLWGREERPKLFINRCLRQAALGRGLAVAGTGAARRNYLWVGDVAAIVRAAQEQCWQGVRVAAGPRALSIRDMASAVASRSGVPITFVEDLNEVREDVAAEVSPGVPTTDFFVALDAELRMSA